MTNFGADLLLGCGMKAETVVLKFSVIYFAAVDHLESMGCSAWKVSNFEETWMINIFRGRRQARGPTLPPITPKLLHQATTSTTWT